jgi:hypothetical protein
MDSDQASPRRFVPIGIALLALVTVALVGAWLLNARFRPAADVVPNPTRTQSIAGATPTASGAHVTTVASPPTEEATTGSPTTLANMEQAIEQAYLRYWTVYSEALYTLDTSRLEEVMAGTALALAAEQVEQLRSQGQAAKIDVEHNYVILDVGPTSAAIEDHYLNRSYLVDLATNQQLQSPGEGEVESIACRLELMGGVWKVVEVVQVSQ